MEHKYKIADIVRTKKLWSYYVGTHAWIKRRYGLADRCENPGCTSVNTEFFDWHNLSGRYLRDISDWQMLCRKCHIRKNIGDYCKRGHSLEDSSNLYFSRHGYRVCKACTRLRTAKYKRKVSLGKL